VTTPSLVTIGLPTHNGEKYIESALAALLAQDHAELEIVVSDNASTDATPGIVRDLMARDRRVRYERVDELVSAAANFNRVFALASGPYFMWAADDDLWDPSYVGRCLAALESDPEAVMASTGLRFIDPAGDVLESNYARYDNPDLSSRSVVERVRILMRRGGFYQIYGLARRDALERTRLFQDMHGPDVVLTLELAMLGPILRIPEPLFFYRRYPDRTDAVRDERQGGIREVADVAATRMTHLQEALSDAVRHSALPAATKLRLRAEILRAAYVEDTPMRSRTRREVASRAAESWRARDAGGIVKYTTAVAIDRTKQLVRPGRPRSSGVRRLGGRSKRFAARVWRRVRPRAG
jgi:glycosyltransferase involved in cell wall biosynthesis